MVSSLTDDFSRTGTGVTLTPDGVAFGPYADARVSGGELRFAVVGNPALRTIRNLALDMRYYSTSDTGGLNAPWVRIYVQDDVGRGPDDSYLFRPAVQPIQPDADPGPFHEWVPTSGSWQLDNDGSLGDLVSWSDLMASSADSGREVHGIAIGLGHTSFDGSLTGLLRWWEINGTTYAFRG